MRLFLLATIARAGYELQGCYSLNQPLLEEEQLPENTVDICTTKCIQNTKLYSLITIDKCYCVDSLQDFNIVKRNSNECTTLCKDMAPCGGRDRLSGYKLLNTNQVQTVPYSQPTENAQGGIGQGNTINDRQIALFSSIGAVVLIIGILVGIYYHRRKQFNKIPTLPRLVSTKSDKYLVPGKLVQTQDMIYIVSKGYEPKRMDELKLEKGDVCCVLEWDSEFALGNNLTSGDKGRFPLSCLVDE